MTAHIIDGKAIAADLRGKVADAVHRLVRDRGITPGLAVVLVGNNPASESLCRQQDEDDRRQRHAVVRSPAAGDTTSEAELLALVARLNADPTVHGILVQLPLPPQIDAQKVIAAIDPAKDVDGFHPVNAGRLSAGLPALAPCTPLGCVLLAKTVHAVARRARSGGDRPLQHRRQAAGAAAAGGERDRDDRAFAHARSARRSAGAPTSCSRRWAGRRWCGATGSSPAPP